MKTLKSGLLDSILCDSQKVTLSVRQLVKEGLAVLTSWSNRILEGAMPLDWLAGTF